MNSVNLIKLGAIRKFLAGLTDSDYCEDVPIEFESLVPCAYAESEVILKLAKLEGKEMRPGAEATIGDELINRHKLNWIRGNAAPKQAEKELNRLGRDLQILDEESRYLFFNRYVDSKSWKKIVGAKPESKPTIAAYTAVMAIEFWTDLHQSPLVRRWRKCVLAAVLGSQPIQDLSSLPADDGDNDLKALPSYSSDELINTNEEYNSNTNVEPSFDQIQELIVRQSDQLSTILSLLTKDSTAKITGGRQSIRYSKKELEDRRKFSNEKLMKICEERIIAHTKNDRKSVLVNKILNHQKNNSDLFGP